MYILGYLGSRIFVVVLITSHLTSRPSSVLRGISTIVMEKVNIQGTTSCKARIPPGAAFALATQSKETNNMISA